LKVAIIGSGISGLTCAYLLNQNHHVTVFEKSATVGGHTATKDIEVDGKQYAIDTGFIVFNDWTYPNFIKLLQQLDVASEPSSMGFSVSCDSTGLEYAGNNLNTVFAQRKNLLRPSFLRMLRDILRFNRRASSDLENQRIREDISLGDYLAQEGYSKKFASHYLIPMGSAIWSSTLQEMLDFPLLFFVRFFKNHGLLSVTNRPQWYVISGGSRQYIKPLIKNYENNIVLNADIHAVARDDNGVFISFGDGRVEQFDEVVFACHSDQALALLDKPSEQERTILSAIPYRNNRVVLHSDTSILPRCRRVWSSWNYHLHEDSSLPPTLSYNMNILQNLQADTTFVVSLNPQRELDSSKIFGEYEYAHPIFTLEGIAAQNRWSEINGVKHTWFCGAYWRNGFHEDGCASAVRVAKGLGALWE